MISNKIQGEIMKIMHLLVASAATLALVMLSNSSIAGFMQMEYLLKQS
jgi:hypothetical protein